jgi:hypothetical protein
MATSAHVPTRLAFPLPEIAFCEEKIKLLATFYGAMREMVALHQESATALMCDQAWADVDGAMDRAREAKDRAKHAYVLHVTHHGCGTDLVDPPESGPAG